MVERNRRIRELQAQGEPVSPLIPRIRQSDGSIYEHAGELDYIDPDVNETTGTVDVRGTFPNPDHNLRPGQFVTLQLATEGTLRRVVIRWPPSRRASWEPPCWWWTRATG